MRPMTARDALEIARSRAIADSGQSSRILDALVELREAIVSMQRPGEGSESAYSKWLAAEHKLAALERGESPKE